MQKLVKYTALHRKRLWFCCNSFIKI